MNSIENENMVNENSRRGFLKKVTAGVYGLVTFLVGLPLISFFISPAFKKTKEEWIEIGPVGDFNSSEPVSVKYEFDLHDGWNLKKASATVWVYKTAGELVAISPICTHLGCTVSFDSGRNSFACPCHRGLYDKSGSVIGGPPPKSLMRHEIKIADGKLIIGKRVDHDPGIA